MDWKKKLFPKKPWWKNLWFSDWRDAFIFFWAIFMVFAFIHDTAEYREVALNPCDYCACQGYYVGGDYEWKENGISSQPVNFESQEKRLMG